MGTSQQPRGQQSALAQVLLHTLRLLAGVVGTAAALVLAAWLLVLGTRKYTDDKPWRVFPPDYGCDNRLLLDSCTAQEAAYMWLLPSVLALCCLGLLALRAQLNSSAEHRTGVFGRLSTRLLPPKRFWLWWCGGLSVSDALAVAFWAAFNASWAVAVLTRFWSLIPFFSRGKPAPLSLELQLVAVAFGVLLLPNFVLLFYPVTRGSVVLQAANLSYPDAIRYHRWLGHAVMVMVTAHSLGFWGIWLYQGTFMEEAFDQGRVFNNLAGGVSFLGGLALWLSSLEVARRSNYEVFYKLHHAGFWVFMFAGCCHYWEMFWYFLPGMLLYGVDGVYRIHQGLGFWGSSSSSSSSSSSAAEDGCVQVLEADASPGKTTCSLLLAAPRFAVAASGFVWLNVPDISWHSWHPFEYFAVPTAAAAAAAGGGSNGPSAAAAAAAGPATGMLLHIKAYDRWTKQLVSLIANRGVKFAVKIEGPYGELPGAVLGHQLEGGSGDSSGTHKHGSSSSSKTAAGAGGASDSHAGGGPDGIIIAAGGVGATAAMSVFQELATAGEAAAVRGLPTLLVWCCRKADELEFLAPRLFAMAHALGLSLTVRLYCTGDPAATSGAALAAAHGSKPATAPAATAARGTSRLNNNNTSGASASSSNGAAHGGGSSSVPGAMATSSMCPVVGLRSFWCQTGHKALLHLIAFAGAFCAILAVRYLGVVRPATTAGFEPWTTGQKGSALVALIAASILVPGLLALWAALGLQAWQQRRQAGSGSKPAAGWLPVSTRGGGARKSGAGKSELLSHLLHDIDSSTISPVNTPAAASAPAAAAAAANALAAAAAAASGSSGDSSSSSTSAVAAAAVAARGFATIRAGAAAGSWELELPAAPAAADEEGGGGHGTHGAHESYAVHQGRPPLAQLVTSWLADTLQSQQLPLDGDEEHGRGNSNNTTSSSNHQQRHQRRQRQQQGQQLQVVAYGMGPSRLVEDVQLLCDSINAGAVAGGAGGAGSSRGVFLGFVQKTHEL